MEYFCNVCDQEFKSELNLEKHNKTSKHINNIKLKELKEEIENLKLENLQLTRELNKNKNFSQEIESLKLDISRITTISSIIPLETILFGIGTIGLPFFREHLEL